MNRPNSSSATIIPKLQGILTEDIEVLQGMLRSRTEDSSMYELIDSLIFAKEKILKLLPNSEGMDEVPTPGQRRGLEGYRTKNTTEIKDQYLMVGILLDIEKTQLDFVKAASVEGGMPEDILKTVDQITQIYMKIVDQLGRSKSTQQLGTIVI